MHKARNILSTSGGAPLHSRARHKHGSIIVMMLGLIWLMSIMVAVVYTIGAQLQEVLVLRELQQQHWHAVQGGLMTALADINDRAELYHVQQPKQPMLRQILYEGLWDPPSLLELRRTGQRHTDLKLRLMIEGEGENQLKLIGILFKSGRHVCAVAWHLRYDAEALKWHYLQGEQIYENDL